MYELALFAGAGGGLLASKLLGWRTVCYVENNPHCVEALKARIRDGYLDNAPIWDDVRTFDGSPWAGCVDILTAGFPCQPFAAGGKHLQETDQRNRWPDTLRIIREIRPKFIFLENSPRLLLVNRGRAPYIERIAAELAASGYVGRYGCLSAAALGADHIRKRLWIFANARGQGREIILRGNATDRAENHQQMAAKAMSLGTFRDRISRLEQGLGEPCVFGTPDGVANRVERLEAVGNGQVPAVAARAWELLVGGWE